jgi:hypothetical protein
MTGCKMTTKKSRSDRGPKHAEDIGATWLKTHDAANAMRGLIKSIGMSAEQKITLDDGINNLARDVEAMMDGIEMASGRPDQKKLLAAYKKFLEHTMEIVNQRLKEI